jgi:hypothetical protein
MTSLLAIMLAAALGAGSSGDDRAVAVRLAREALVRVLQIEDAQIRVEEVREIQWPDAALGCPEKGAQYAQVVVPGHSLRLVVDGKSHRVHVGNGRAVVCDREAPAEPPKYMQTVVRVQDLARRDLAARLKVEVRDVKVLRVRPATWPDAGLGCPEPSQRHEPAETRGFLVELEHAAKTYRYHSDRERVVYCP